MHRPIILASLSRPLHCLVNDQDGTLDLLFSMEGICSACLTVHLPSAAAASKMEQIVVNDS